MHNDRSAGMDEIVVMVKVVVTGREGRSSTEVAEAMVRGALLGNTHVSRAIAGIIAVDGKERINQVN